jgi:hypothetical protein
MDSTFDRPLLRLSATLLLVEQLLYVVITLFDTGGEATIPRSSPLTPAAQCEQAVNAGAIAPDPEKAARFPRAETMRWLEWGTRSYEDFTRGLAVLSAAAVVRIALIPRPIAYLMVLSAFTYFAQGWLAGAEGFSQTHTFAIILAELLDATWMTWLLIAAWRMPPSESVSDRLKGASTR